MLPASIARDTVTVQHPQTINDHGTPVADWSKPPSETPVVGCSVQPAKGQEDELHRSGDRADMVVWLPPSASITADDHIAISGYPRPFRVIGEPERWPTGNLAHTVVRLQIWEG